MTHKSWYGIKLNQSKQVYGFKQSQLILIFLCILFPFNYNHYFENSHIVLSIPV